MLHLPTLPSRLRCPVPSHQNPHAALHRRVPHHGSSPHPRWLLFVVKRGSAILISRRTRSTPSRHARAWARRPAAVSKIELENCVRCASFPTPTTRDEGRAPCVGKANWLLYLPL